MHFFVFFEHLGLTNVSKSNARVTESETIPEIVF